MATWGDLLAGWAAELRAAGAGPGTVRLRTSHLRQFARLNPDPLAAGRADLVAWLAREQWAPETRKSHRSSLTGFYGWCAAAGHLPASPAAGLRPVRVPPPAPRPADDDDIVTARLAADPDVALMIRLASEAGLRRAEVARVHTGDLELGGLRVHGKGGVTRVVTLPRDLRAELARRPAGWVFPSPARPGRPVTPGHVGRRISALLPDGVTPHMLRHAWATALHDEGLDVADIRPQAGHASIRTTQLYVHVRPERARPAVEAAAARLHPAPARRRTAAG